MEKTVTLCFKCLIDKESPTIKVVEVLRDIILSQRNIKVLEDKGFIELEQSYYIDDFERSI